MSSPPVVGAARAAATFPPDPAVVRSARQLVASTLAQWGVEALSDEATLLTSELVTNAVVHAGTAVEVTLALLDEAVEIAVTDRHPARAVPAPPDAEAGPDTDPDRVAEGGRGLALVSALAPAWGVDYSGRSKRVWFRLPLLSGSIPSPRGGFDEHGGDGDPEPVPEPMVATVQLAGDGTVAEADANTEILLGRPAAEIVGRAWADQCDPADAGTLVLAAASHRWQGTYTLRRGDGQGRLVLARHVRLAPGSDGAARTVCVLVDHRLRVLVGEIAAAHRPAAVVDGPFALAPDQLVRLDLDALLDRTVGWARETFEADRAYAFLVDEDEDDLELRAVAGPRPAQHRRRLPDPPTVPVLLEDLRARPDQDPWLAEVGAASAMTVPLVAAGRLVGAVMVASARPAAFGVADATRLQRAADSVTLAVASARFAEIERRRHGWLGYLAEAGELLAGTLELDRALALVAQLVSPKLGPWCAIHLIDEAGRPKPAIVWHSDEERGDDLARLLAAGPAPTAAPGAAVRWRSEPAGPGTADLAAAGGHVVALVARGRVLGSLLVGNEPAGPARHGDSRAYRHLLADLAPRAALALDNARLYAERTSTSQALQRSLLPPELPSLPGLEVGVVYEAAGAANEVGGDFYDIFLAPAAEGTGGERFGFAVGDVCGKGPEAAAVTGLARTALRVLSRRGDDIPDVLRHLNSAILAEGSRARFLTAIYGEGHVDPDGVTLRLACAGHPRPVLLHADGSVEQVGECGDLLGVFDGPQIPVTRLRLAPGEALVCFTDGVTERRRGAAMLGEEGVLAAVHDGADLPAGALARRLGTLVRDYDPDPARDDVAVLVLRALPRP